MNSLISQSKNHQHKAILFLEKMASESEKRLLSFTSKNDKYYFEYRGHLLFFYKNYRNKIYFGHVSPVTQTEILIELPQEYMDQFNKVVWIEPVLDDILNNESEKFSFFSKISKFLFH